ncbi:hypothetical protein KAR48_20315 [bacterium]|nr:hypothetical protein [bacterium]
MKCHDMPEILVALLYGDIDADQKALAEKHIDTCDACRAEWNELKKTAATLSEWEDPEPEMQHHFIVEKTSRFADIIEQLREYFRPKRVLIAIPVVLGTALVLLSLMNFQAEYTNGQWHIAFGVTSTSDKSAPDPAILTSTLHQMQQETLLMVSDLLKENEIAQNQRVSAIFTNYVNQFENQRRKDLFLYDQELEGLHLATQGRLNQNSQAINNLLEMATYSLDKK